MAITIKGRIKSISPLQSAGSGDKPFQFKEMLLETELDTKYPQLLNIQFAGKAMDNTDSSNSGDIVEVDINLKGRAANNGKVYNTISGWKVKLIEKGDHQPSSNYTSQHQADVDKWTNTGQSTIPQDDRFEPLPF